MRASLLKNRQTPCGHPFPHPCSYERSCSYGFHSGIRYVTCVYQAYFINVLECMGSVHLMHERSRRRQHQAQAAAGVAWEVCSSTGQRIYCCCSLGKPSLPLRAMERRGTPCMGPRRSHDFKAAWQLVYVGAAYVEACAMSDVVSCCVHVCFRHLHEWHDYWTCNSGSETS